MKKTILLALISAFVFTIGASAQANEKQVLKDAKKEAKSLKKEGWQVSPGALPLERQLEDAYRKLYDRDELGFPKYFVGSAQPTSEFYDAAKIQAQSLAKVDIAGQSQSQLKGIVENAVANKMLSKEEAASIEQITMKSTEMISGSLGRTVPLVECYRKLPNGNTQVMIRLAYPTSQALEQSKQVVRDQLEKELKGLGEKLDKAVQNFK